MPIQPKQQPPYYTPGSATATSQLYKASLTQTTTNAPTPTIHQNSLGEIPTWSRTGTGVYLLTALNPIFEELKTSVMISGVNQGFAYYTWISETELQITTRDITGTPADEYLFYTAIYIEINQ